MSRCYPYLRSNRSSSGSSVVVRNGIGGSDGPLIESFKLQSKHEKPKTEQVREKGREKEKRKVRKQKGEKHHDFSDAKVKNLKNDKCYKGKKFKDSFSHSCFREVSQEEKNGDLDNSDLTEEHDEPMCVYLSDGTQSSKRKRDCTPSSGITVHRNILRIRLPSQKQIEHEAAVSSMEQSCSTAVKVAESGTVRARGKEQSCSTNYINGELPTVISDSARKENVESSGAKTAVCATTSYDETEEQRLYQSLMDDLASTPVLLRAEMDFADDQEWLFETKHPRQASKKLKASDDVSCRQSSTMFPRAQYLPEADIYSLPYTIPF
ncbi:hypothetical protein ACOSP7_011165 [Xanthoceras sorbifolium]